MDEVGENQEPTKVLELSQSELSMPINAGGTEKPQFSMTEKCTVVDAKFRKMDRPSKDSKEKEFFPVSLVVTYEHKSEQSNEIYNGGRMYDGDNGPYFWVGVKSQLGQLKKKVEDSFGKKDLTMVEFLNLLRGVKVGVKTEDFKFNGESHLKNIIQYIDK